MKNRYQSIHFSFLRIDLNKNNKFIMESAVVDGPIESYESKNFSDIFDNYKRYMNKKLKNIINKNPIIANSLSNLLNIELQSFQFSSVLKNKNGSQEQNEKILFHFSERLEVMEQKIMSVINLINDRDVLRHLKNSKFDFNFLNKMLEYQYKEKNIAELITTNEQHIEYYYIKNIEKLDDKINEIVLDQKTKKFMQKTFSEKYRFLINENTHDLIKELVMKEVSRSEFKGAFGKKIARYKDAEEFNSDLKHYIQSSQGWSLEHYKKIAKDNDVEIHYEKNNKMCVRIDTYEQSKNMGSNQWCIVYDEHHFKRYKEDGCLFYIFDFNKDIDDNTCMLGINIDYEGQIEAAHWKNDDEVGDISTEIELESGFDEYIDFIPDIDDPEDHILNRSENIYFNSLDKRDKANYIFRKKMNLEDGEFVLENLKGGIINNIPTDVFVNLLPRTQERDVSKNMLIYGKREEYEGLRKDWENVVIYIIKNNKTDLENIGVAQKCIDTENQLVINSYIQATRNKWEYKLKKINNKDFLSLGRRDKISENKTKEEDIGFVLENINQKKLISKALKLEKSKNKPN